MTKHLLALWFAIGLVAVASAAAIVSVVLIQRHQNDALHSIMCRAVTVVERTPVSSAFTAKQKAHALRFYRSALSHANLPPCH